MNTTLTPADLDPRRQAMLLYFQGYRVARIAEMLGEKVATVHSWKKRDKWGDYGPLDQMQLTTAARYCQLIMKEHKEGKDFKEIDLLARQSERHARIGKFNNGGNEADLNPNVANRNKGPRRQPEKNVFTDEQIEKLEEIFHSSMFNYQRHWWEAGKTNRIRNLLKSRQIGATFYFAREALIDALLTGRNQIFLSASKAQTGETPGTFRLDIGVQDQGITEDTYLELERLISDAKPCSRHMIGMSINLQTSGPHWVGAASYLGEEITIYPYI
ncbi:terminase family protein, partial [Escherichia coli]|nr:terminase family protein [Escherichia coli]